MLLVPVLFFGAPKGSSVSSGQAQIQVSGPNTTIQTSHQAVIDWDSFSVKRGEIVEFIQPSSQSSVINRVGREASVIDGFLKANGRVYLLNPNGVLVGKTGVVSCGSFLATTLDFDTAQCLGGGNLHMNGKSAEVIMNCGTIRALSGDVILLARAVINEGTLEAKEGVVGMAAAGEVLLKPEGRERLFISMSDEGEGSIENGGLIQAAHAELKADGNVYRLAINQTGVVEATGIGKENGKIVLRAEGATVENSGTVQANSGSIHLIGDEVHLQKGTELNVSGSSGGGEILIGGDYQGNNPEIPKARCVSFDEGALANASGIGCADGGRVVLWSDQSTTFEGTILARGGDLGGNGGFIEISSPGFLAFKGRSDLRAASGEYGTLLLDPTNVLISDSDTAGVSLEDGTYVPIADTAIIKASDLVTALSAGNVLVTTQSDFENAGDIEVQSDVTWG